VSRAAPEAYAFQQTFNYKKGKNSRSSHICSASATNNEMMESTRMKSQHV